jgi:hypothetical protein
MSNSTPPIDELRDIFAAWLAAIPNNDVAFLGRTLDPTWHYTDHRGHVHDKGAYLHQVGNLIRSDHRTGLVDFEARQLSEHIAVCFGRYTSRGTMNNGSIIEQDSRFTAVWSRETGAWQALAHQATNVGEPYA